MKKDFTEQVKYYCSLPYQVVIEKWDDGRGVYYVARVIELPDLFMTGATPEEAVAELESVKREWIETNLELGNKMPEPLSSHKYSGSIVLRIPSSLHETLARISQMEGVSLNQYMVSALSRVVGRDEVLIKERKATYKKK
jgi:predicted RNase H-like HicB family nuclease